MSARYLEALIPIVQLLEGRMQAFERGGRSSSATRAGLFAVGICARMPKRA
jgi:hypothetical protein